ncbi:MAG: GNAT family N-acetyltransferase [Clostridiales bacterium]|nr:GNAT family N-acetyltransferase [Clostridiales bacterium]MCD8367408.1 GNAT family N-acetyltransferase [Clostridiales bacterium]
MSVCTFLAADCPLAAWEPSQDYPLEINLDDGTIEDGGAEDNYSLQPFTYYYFIQENSVEVGAIRVVDTQEPGTAKRISPLFILPRYRNQGLAQKAIRAVEALHGPSNWELATILQEAGNCYLYEKMGYRQTGTTVPVNDKMTLVIYRK